MHLTAFKKFTPTGILVCLSLLSGGAVMSQSPASFSGAIVYTAPNEAITSITAQIVLPTGLYFGSNVTVSYTTTGTSGSNSFRPTSLTLEPGTIVYNSLLSPATQVASNLAQISNLTGSEANLSAYLTIVRAAASGSGLD